LYNIATGALNNFQKIIYMS